MHTVNARDMETNICCIHTNVVRASSIDGARELQTTNEKCSNFQRTCVKRKDLF